MSIFYIWFWGLLRAFMGTCVVGPPSTHPSQQARQRSKPNHDASLWGSWVGWICRGPPQKCGGLSRYAGGVSSGVPSPAPTWGADHKQTTSGHMGRLNKTARLYLLGKILGGGGALGSRRAPLGAAPIWEGRPPPLTTSRGVPWAQLPFGRAPLRMSQI